MRKAADPKAGGNVALGDDAPKLASFFGVSRNRLVGFEVQITLDRKAEFAADGLQFDEAHVAEFRLAHAEIAEAEGQAVVGIELLGPHPGPSPCGPALREYLKSVQNGSCRFSRSEARCIARRG